MALYRFGVFVKPSHHPAFRILLRPGTPAPYSGVYRCVGCGREETSKQHDRLPPQNHHQHSASQGRIRWRLIVAAAHRR